ncbi:unnamed protein product [Paramecium pentaurelia]|uniref:Peptidase M20 dimerisation domain-containing protein n=1 Tax=Paramecium pentaurelia TaxID=43138 RepID=A0A8S1XYF4_9CILI|nr:unnamed protein product [Paramecium pentaurelia]
MKSTRVDQIRDKVYNSFDESLPVLMDILRIPSMSREFDNEYLTNGLLLKTAQSFEQYIRQANLKNAQIQLYNDEGFSPFLFVEVEGSDGMTDGTVLFYGHMDKQPPFTGWREGISAYDPKIIDDKLYGRGGADDGYAIMASVIAIKTIQELGLKHPRIIMAFEADEESGSQHIYHYLDKLKEKIGQVDLVIALDASCGSYDRLWVTTTLRGIVVGTVTVQVLNEGIHSGESGIIPSSFRIFRQLLNRIDNPQTGDVVDDFQVIIPGKRYLETQKTAEVFKEVITKFPFHQNTQPVFQDRFLVYLNKIWRAQLSVTGGDDIPNCNQAGNVITPKTTLKLSLRLPPTKNHLEAKESFVKLLTTNVPYNASVTISGLRSGPGFNALDNQPYLDSIINQASLNYYGNEATTFGDGGAIYLMTHLQLIHPKASFLIIGVLGTGANEHGPNECLDLPNVRKLISCITEIISEVQPHIKK